MKDPTRGWRGVAPDGLPRLRLALYSDCSWRRMDGAHGPHNPPGWPLCAAERLVERGIGLEVSVVTVIGLPQLPATGEELERWLRLSGPPDAVLVQAGNIPLARRLLPTSERWDRLRVGTARTLGRHIFTARRLQDPIVGRVGRPIATHPGPEPLARFLEAASEQWPDAAVAAMPPFPHLALHGSMGQTEARIHADLRVSCAAAGAEILDASGVLAPHGTRARCANRYNLNATGCAVVGELVADWLAVRAGSPVPA
jgi:hypothetical protein